MWSCCYVDFDKAFGSFCYLSSYSIIGVTVNSQYTTNYIHIKSVQIKMKYTIVVGECTE